VDTSTDAKLATKFRGFLSEEIISFKEALAGFGLKPNDIDIVLQTHLHWDHCANTRKCKNAKVIVQKEELRFALAPHPISAPSYKKDLLTDLNFMVVRGPHEVFLGIDLIPRPPAKSPGVNPCQ
jgi:glyoxylase-like metal-dependent hydrolase (beta-lactamase superfamily II)